MDIFEAANKNGFNNGSFVAFLKANDYTIEPATFLRNASIPDSQADLAIKAYKEHLAQEKAAAVKAAAAAAEEERARQAALAQILVTSGFNFDGYTVTKYSGYISGDDVIEIPRGTSGIFLNATNVGDALSKSLVKIRRNALQELKEAAYDLGCNAIIGVDFDYITLEPETARSNGGTMYLPYVFCVTANGNAVVIEKDETK